MSTTGWAILQFCIKTLPQISDSNEITCHDFCPHFSHFLLQCVLPAFLPRIPPRSHNELLCPHLQCTLHARESFSIASNQRFGKTAETNFWMKLINNAEFRIQNSEFRMQNTECRIMNANSDVKFLVFPKGVVRPHRKNPVADRVEPNSSRRRVS